MSTSRFKHVFTPLRLGPVTIANRIVFSAHLTNYAEDGLPTQQHAEYYAARARGGAGLIITEEHSTHPTDWPYEKLIHGFHPAVIPGYRQITDAVHRHNTPIFAQINHNGGQASGMYTRLPVWAPSPVADPLFREVPKEVDESEIAEIIAGYALVAEHCRDGGFDGIELQCSHSSIVRGFLSPATNVRTDRWGGSLDNRARLLLELVAAVRDAIGRDMALGVRLCGDELIEGGTTIDEAVEVAKLVEATGHVDYLNTSIGVATQTLYMIEASMAVRPGYALFIPAALRRATRLPVVGVGRFKDALQADRAIAAGQCDMVGVVRGQIADPDFARKSRSGPRRGRAAVPVVQPGMRRAHGPEPLARLHRGAAHRARGDRRRSPAADADAAAAQGDGGRRRARRVCRPGSRRRSAATTSPSTKRRRAPAARCGSRRASRRGPSSAISSATRRRSSSGSAAGWNAGSPSTWTWSAGCGPTPSSSPPAPPRRARRGCLPSRRSRPATCVTCSRARPIRAASCC